MPVPEEFRYPLGRVVPTKVPVNSSAGSHGGPCEPPAPAAPGTLKVTLTQSARREAQSVEIPENLLCLFSAQVEERAGSYVIEVPEQELQHGELAECGIYRVSIHAADSPAPATPPRPDTQPAKEVTTPPVESGETRLVEIEDIGTQGDGITRVDRGFVVIVPETETGERVTVEITDVKSNVAFAEVVERHSYYE